MRGWITRHDLSWETGQFLSGGTLQHRRPYSKGSLAVREGPLIPALLEDACGVFAFKEE
jgi:hypothetical protein